MREPVHTTKQWPASLLAAVRAELSGNARRDLLGWAHRTLDARQAGCIVAVADVQRARLVLDLSRERA